MRQSIRDLVGIVAKHISVEGPAYELGSYQVQPASLSDMRPFFPGLEYVGCDMRPGPGVDQVSDMHALPFKDETAGFVLCLDALEHVERPWDAVREMHRILRPGGMLLLVTVMNFPIHEYPWDFWRFTPEGLLSLCRPQLSPLYLITAGPVGHPVTVGVLAGKTEMQGSAALKRELDHWSARWELRSG